MVIGGIIEAPSQRSASVHDRPRPPRAARTWFVPLGAHPAAHAEQPIDTCEIPVGPKEKRTAERKIALAGRAVTGEVTAPQIREAAAVATACVRGTGEQLGV